MSDQRGFTSTVPWVSASKIILLNICINDLGTRKQENAKEICWWDKTRCYHQSRRGQDITRKDHNDLEDWSNGEGIWFSSMDCATVLLGTRDNSGSHSRLSNCQLEVSGAGKAPSTNHRTVTRPQCYITQDKSNTKSSGWGVGKTGDWSCVNTKSTPGWERDVVDAAGVRTQG